LGGEGRVGDKMVYLVCISNSKDCTDQGGKMNNFFLGLIILAIIVVVIIFIWVMVELRKAIRALKELVNTTENSFKPTLAELQETLKSVRNVADNVTGVTGDMKVLSGALKNVGKSVNHVAGDVEHVANLVDGITSSAAREASGLKAGIKAGALVLLKNLFK
jgi:uncharacterized protein YoxC